MLTDRQFSAHLQRALTASTQLFIFFFLKSAVYDIFAHSAQTPLMIISFKTLLPVRIQNFLFDDFCPEEFKKTNLYC